GPSGNLGNIRSSVTFNGGTGQDAVFLFDDVFTGNPTYTLTSSAVTVGGLAGFQLNYNNSVEGLTLFSGDGAGTALVPSSAAGVTMTLNMGAGNDTVRVGAPGLFNFGPVVVNGEGGSDQLIVDDQANGSAQTSTVTPWQVTRTGGGVAAITYNGTESLVLNTGSGAETINIDGTAATTPVRVNAQGGADRFNVRAIASPVTLNAGAGDDLIVVADAAGQIGGIRALLRVNGDGGRDVLIVDDRGWNLSDETYRVRPTSVEVPSIPGFGLDFTTVEEVRLLAGPRDNTILVLGTAANVLTVIEAGDGNDQIHIGS